MIDYTKLHTDVVDLIEKKFDGIVDKGGNPYIEHLYYVADQISMEMNGPLNMDYTSLRSFYEHAVIVALLHDILEDTDCTVDDLYALGCDQEIVDDVVILTKPKQERYVDYIKRVNTNNIARLVKIYDLQHNMDITRLKVFGEYEHKRLEKYWKAYKYLTKQISDAEYK